jgi:hypothetical protein
MRPRYESWCYVIRAWEQVCRSRWGSRSVGSCRTVLPRPLNLVASRATPTSRFPGVTDMPHPILLLQRVGLGEHAAIDRRVGTPTLGGYKTNVPVHVHVARTRSLLHIRMRLTGDGRTRGDVLCVGGSQHSCGRRASTHARPSCHDGVSAIRRALD